MTTGPAREFYDVKTDMTLTADDTRDRKAARYVVDRLDPQGALDVLGALFGEARP